MARPAADVRLASAYRQSFNLPSSATVLADLLDFAFDEKDPHVRAGRMDMIARILRQRGKGIPDTGPSVFESEDNS